MSEIHDCGSEAAAYVLGALEPAEADAFRQHMAQCIVCRDEVQALGGVVDALPMAAPQHPAPRELRRRVMSAVWAEAPLPPARRRSVRARWPWPTARPALLAAIATAAVALAVVGGLQLSSGGAARVIQARVAGISGAAQLRLSNGRGELVVHHLSPPPAGHVYEVWLTTPHGPPTPASVLFSVGASGSAAVGLPDSLRGVSQVLVTPEPRGGSPMPTHRPVIVATLTAAPTE